MLRYFYLTWFSQPAADRPLYKTVAKRTIRSIVEIGIGEGIRTRRLFEMALKPCHAVEPLRYVGIDLFEAREKGSPGLSLKQAYGLLKRERVKLQLVPGDPLMALTRVANTLKDIDLLIISQGGAEAIDQAWRFVPRILHSESLVYLEQPGQKANETKFVSLSASEVSRLATDAQRAIRRAA